MIRKGSLLVIGTLVLLGMAPPATAVDQGKAKYVGGTLASVKVKTEAPVSLLEQNLVFTPKGARIEIPWSAVDDVGYSAHGMGSQSRITLGLLTPYSLFFTKGKKHCVTLAFHDAQNTRQFAIFEFDKGDIRAALSVIKLRTGKAIACEGENVASPIEACHDVAPGEVAAAPPIRSTEPAEVAATPAPSTKPATVAAPPPPITNVRGPRVRVLAPTISGSLIAGELVASDDATITIRRTQDEPLAGGRSFGKTLRLPREDVARFERSLRPGRKTLGAGIGLVVGFAVGAAALCSGGGNKCGDQSGMALIIVGGFPGMLLGAAVAPGERWQAEDPRGVRIGAGPAQGGRVHVALVPKRHGSALQVAVLF